MEQDVNITETTTPTDTGVPEGSEAVASPESTDVSPEGTGVGTTEPTVAPAVSEETFGLSKENWDAINADPNLSMRAKELQAAWTKKTQALAEQNKELTFAEKMQDPTYRQQVAEWAQMNTPMDVQSEQQQSMKFYYENWDNPRLTNEQRTEYLNQLSETEMMTFNTALQQKTTAIKQAQLDMEKEDSANIKVYGDNYGKLLRSDNGINKTIAGLKQGQVPLTAEFVYKAIDYHDYGKRMLEKGRQEVLTNRTNAINGNLNQPSGTAPSSVPMKGTLREQMLAAVDRFGDNVPEVFR